MKIRKALQAQKNQPNPTPLSRSFTIPLNQLFYRLTSDGKYFEAFVQCYLSGKELTYPSTFRLDQLSSYTSTGVVKNFKVDNPIDLTQCDTWNKSLSLRITCSFGKVWTVSNHLEKQFKRGLYSRSNILAYMTALNTKFKKWEAKNPPHSFGATGYVEHYNPASIQLFGNTSKPEKEK